MKVAYTLLFIALGSSAVAAAQQPSQASAGGTAATTVGPGQPASTFIFEPPQSCPVTLQARQSGMTDLVKVNRGAHSQQEPNAETLPRPGQRVELIVPRADSGIRIIGAVVTVRGLTARGRIDRTADGYGAADLRRTLDISFVPKDDKTISAELVLPGFTSVKSIKLESLRYADGSSRDFSAQRLCSVTPDPMMLIAGR